MPPHGGFAIGLERLTAQILNLPNVRQATLYPRDRTKLTPQESPPHKFRWLRRLDLNHVQIQSAWEGAESVAKEAKVVPGEGSGPNVCPLGSSGWQRRNRTCLERREET